MSDSESESFDPVQVACKAVEEEKEPEISWSIDVGELDTYFQQEDKLDIGQGNGINNLKPVKFESNSAGPQLANEQHQEGTAIQCLNDAIDRQKAEKKRKENNLDKFFGLPKQEMTKEMKKELQILKLRRYAAPGKFYKTNDSKKLPTHFHIGVEVGGGMQAVGSNTNLMDTMSGGIYGQKKRKGTSFLGQLLQDQKLQAYTKRKAQESTDWGENGRVQKKGGKKKNNGNWRKSKKHK